MLLIKRIGLPFVILSLSVCPALAFAMDFSVDVHAGTLGNGVGGTMSLIKHFNLRAGVNSAEYKIYDLEDDEGLDYSDPELEFDNQYIFIDFHPWRRGNFRLTGGVVFNKNSLTAGARVTDASTLIGTTTAPINTTVDAIISFDSTASYVGIGWGNSVKRGFPLRFGIDVGVMSQGDPRVDLVVVDNTGLITEEDAERERQDLEDEIDGIDLWPVINLSLSYRF